MRAVVLGGTSGIGLATGVTLARSGLEVVVAGRDAQRVRAAADQGLDARRLDATEPAAVEAFFAELGAFDHLVLTFSPGAVGMGPLCDLDPADLRAAFDGKLFAYLHAIRTAQVTGSVTMVSASSARAAYPGTVALAAANGAIERAVPPLAVELAPVRVNAVAPGVVDTPWWDFLPADQRSTQFATLAGQVPVGAVGSPQDVADAIAYLVTAPFVTGTVLAVDGGATAA